MLKNLFQKRIFHLTLDLLKLCSKMFLTKKYNAMSYKTTLKNVFDQKSVASIISLFKVMSTTNIEIYILSLVKVSSKINRQQVSYLGFACPINKKVSDLSSHS